MQHMGSRARLCVEVHRETAFRARMSISKAGFRYLLAAYIFLCCVRMANRPFEGADDI